MGEKTSWAAVHAEIAMQAEVLTATIDDAEPIAAQVAEIARARGADRLLLVGAGASLHAAQAVRWWMEDLTELPCEPMESLEYLGYAYRRDTSRTLIVVISASGRESLTTDALRRALDGPALVVGVTDTHSSPFATETHAAFTTASTKQTGWPTQTTTVAMTVLACLAVALAGPGTRERAAATLRELPGVLQEVVRESEQPMQKLAGELADHTLFGFVGAGPAWGVANGGMMLITMATADGALALETEEFHHGAQAAALIHSGAPIFVIAPEGEGYSRAIDTIQTIEAADGQAIVLGPQQLATQVKKGNVLALPATVESLSPFVCLPPLQWFAYYLASAKVRQGTYSPRAMLIRALDVESLPAQPAS